jgi:hypothetical protein
VQCKLTVRIEVQCTLAVRIEVQCTLAVRIEVQCKLAVRMKCSVSSIIRGKAGEGVVRIIVKHGQPKTHSSLSHAQKKTCKLFIIYITHTALTVFTLTVRELCLC